MFLVVLKSSELLLSLFPEISLVLLTQEVVADAVRHGNIGISHFGFYDFLMILIFLVLCEFVTVFKVFRCSEKLRISGKSESRSSELFITSKNFKNR